MPVPVPTMDLAVPKGESFINYLINFYNQASAGPLNISRQFIDEIMARKQDDNRYFIILPKINRSDTAAASSSGNAKIIFVKKANPFIQIFRRMYFELFLIKKIVREYQIEKVIIFGSYSLVRLHVKKMVLVHHSYLLDDDAYAKLDGMARLTEIFRRMLFALTLRSSPILIVQSDYMRSLLKKKTRLRGNEIVVIANPISRNFVNDREKVREYPGNGKFTLFFPSRAHMHKNHEFVLRIAKYLQTACVSDIHFIITVDPRFIKGKDIIKKIVDENLGDIVENIGELPQSELPRYYKKCSALFFPSETETFGNPLIEGMFYGLPVIAPDLPYAVEICGKAGCFYEPGSVGSAMAQINALRNKDAYLKQCLLSVEQAKKYPEVKEWVDQYLNL